MPSIGLQGAQQDKQQSVVLDTGGHDGPNTTEPGAAASPLEQLERRVAAALRQMQARGADSPALSDYDAQRHQYQAQPSGLWWPAK